MRAASEATRQIVEFEELVSRLDRINDHHHHRRRSSVRPSPSLLPQLSAPLTSSSLLPTVGSIDRQRTTDRGGIRSNGSVTGEPYVTDITADNGGGPSAKPSRTPDNYVAAFPAVNSQENRQARQRTTITRTQNDLQRHNQVFASETAGNLSGSSVNAFYYTPSDERASSFPIDGVASSSRGYYDSLTSRSLQQHPREHLLYPPENPREKRVRVNIGIDEDLRMILEMDPAIVDRQPPTPPSLPPRRPPPPPPPLPPPLPPPTHQQTVRNPNSSAASPGSRPGSRATDCITASSPAQNDNIGIHGNATSGMSTTSSSSSVLVGRPPRATRPQGWYWTPRD